MLQSLIGKTLSNRLPAGSGRQGNYCYYCYYNNNNSYCFLQLHHCWHHHHYRFTGKLLPQGQEAQLEREPTLCKCLSCGLSPLSRGPTTQDSALLPAGALVSGLNHTDRWGWRWSDSSKSPS